MSHQPHDTQLQKRTLYAMLVFTASFLTCFAVFPRWTTFSRYGTMLKTWPLFAVGMSAVAYVLWQFALVISKAREAKRASLMLRTAACAALVLIVVPYTAGVLGRVVHDVVSLTMALCILFASAIIVQTKHKTRLWFFAALQIAGLLVGIACFIFLLHTPSILWGIFEPLFFIGTGGIVLTTIAISSDNS